MEKVEEESKKKVMDGDNLHNNFVDLNPKYREIVHQRAVRLANNWMKNLGSKLLADTDFVGR